MDFARGILPRLLIAPGSLPKPQVNVRNSYNKTVNNTFIIATYCACSTFISTQVTVLRPCGLASGAN